MKRLENKHFEEFGLIPEVLGRFPVVSYTTELTRDNLIQILTEPKDSIVVHYKRLFKSAGVDLSLSEDCLGEFADRALADGIGARGLKKQLENKLKSLLFDIDQYRGKSLLVSKDEISVLEKDEPAVFPV